MDIIGKVAGGILGAAGASNQISAQQEAAKYNASRAHLAAQDVKNTAAQNAQVATIEATKKLGSVRAAYGASGVKMDGTPTEMLEQDAATLHTNVLNILHGGEMQAYGFEQEANMDLKQLGYLNTAKNIAWAGALIGAGGNAGLSTFSGGGGGGGGGGSTTAAGGSYDTATYA